MLQIIRTFCQERVNLTAPLAWEVLRAAVSPPAARSAVSAPHSGSAAQLCYCSCAVRLNAGRVRVRAKECIATAALSLPPRWREWASSDSEIFSVQASNMGRLFHCATFLLVFTAAKGKWPWGFSAFKTHLPLWTTVLSSRGCQSIMCVANCS